MIRFSVLRHVAIALAIIAGGIYASPSLYDSVPVVQVRPTNTSVKINDRLITRITKKLKQENLPVSVHQYEGYLNLRFVDDEQQIRARAALASLLNQNYAVVVNKVNNIPAWLESLNAKSLALGLDLKGGVYFLLQIDSEYAINKRLEGLEVQVERYLRENNVAFDDIAIRADEGAIEVMLGGGGAQIEAVGQMLVGEFGELEIPEQNVRNAALLALTSAAREEIIDVAIEQNVETLRRRIDELGVAEPVVTRQGDARIAVQLPGIQDTARAKIILGRTAALQLRGVDNEKSNSPALISRVKNGGRAPAGLSLVESRDGESLFLRKRVIISGENIVDAQSGLDGTNQPAVFLSLDPKGANSMKRYTRSRVGQRLAIVLIENDTSMIISAPVIRDELFANFQISGSMRLSEASELALLLRAGALATPLRIIEERAIGPSLGADNIASGVNSVIGGFLLVALLIAAYYAAFGLISISALFVNVILLTAMLSILGATLTLPGLAGFALTLGMAIDSNVLINERIREEVARGLGGHKAIDVGYSRAFSTILDSNLTTLIAGVALFFFGSGPVRGFAVVLCFGILTSMFSAIQVSRAIVNLSYENRPKIPRLRLGWRMLNFTKSLTIMRWRKFTTPLSMVFIAICIASFVMQGMNYGIDFTGGTVIEVAFAQVPEVISIREALSELSAAEPIIQITGDGLGYIKIPPEVAGAQFNEQALSVLRTLDPQLQLRRVEFVGPQVSSELFLSGAFALLFVCVGIAVYLSFRFKWRMAIAAIVANFHDVLFILGLFSLFQWEFNLPVLAAILAILGYSVNESVVIFDRVREVFRTGHRSLGTEEVIDTAVTQTFARTVITHGSTQLAVLSMLLFGGAGLFNFALALTLGIFSSIYSSIFIAGHVGMRLGLTRDDFIDQAEDKKADNPHGAVV